MTPTVPDVSAESSPALEVPRESSDYAEWRQTGKLPEKPKAASTPAKEIPAEGEKPQENTAPASETGTHQEKRRESSAATRLNEILQDLKNAGYTPVELKNLKREAQKAEPPAPPAKAATEQTAKPEGLTPPTKPDPAKFKTYEELEAARDKYFEELADYKAAAAIQKDRAERAADAARETTFGKIREAQARYGPEAGKVIKEAALAMVENGLYKIHPAVADLVGTSSVWADLTYAIGSDPAELQKFIQLAKSDPGAAIRRAVVMEQMVKDELAKGGKLELSETERDDSGQFVSHKSPEKKESSAPPPAREVSGRGTAPSNPLERAVKENDFSSYREQQNEKAMKKRFRG